jgi:hypothetical protein
MWFKSLIVTSGATKMESLGPQQMEGLTDGNGGFAADLMDVRWIFTCKTSGFMKSIKCRDLDAMYPGLLILVLSNT